METGLERRSNANIPLRAVIDIGQRMSEKLQGNGNDIELAALWRHALRSFHDEQPPGPEKPLRIVP